MMSAIDRQSLARKLTQAKDSDVEMLLVSIPAPRTLPTTEVARLKQSLLKRGSYLVLLIKQ